MKASIFLYLLSVILYGWENQTVHDGTLNLEFLQDSIRRIVENKVIISDSLPAIEIRLSPEFEYVGQFDFEIIANSDEYEPEFLGKPVAAGERLVCVDSDSNGSVNKLFIVQFEGFFAHNPYKYNYNFDKADAMGNNTYRHNTWFYNSRQLARNNPQNEGAKTRAFLEAKGFQLEDEFMMSRFVGLASEDRKHEIIIYYIEMLKKRTGFTLEELENTANKEIYTNIRSQLVARSRRSFSIIKG